MKLKHICPRCGGTTFETVAHITQTWKVDEYGNFLLALSECDEVTHWPDNDNIWVCSACGTEGLLYSKDYAPLAIPERFAKLDPPLVEIGFVYVNEAKALVEIKNIPVRTLYVDWARNAKDCPPNDVMVTSVTMRDVIDNSAETILTRDPVTGNAIMFDMLAMILAATWPQMSRDFITRA